VLCAFARALSLVAALPSVVNIRLLSEGCSASIEVMTQSKRIMSLLCLLIVCLVAAIGLHVARRPAAAPPDIQESGRAIILIELTTLSQTDFGRSGRGRLLVAEVEYLLRHNRIVFSAQLKGKRGLSWSEWWGPKTIFIRILEVNEGRYIHQMPSQIVECLFHEALHSIKGRFHGTSIEEECDAFAAGLCAEAASKGIEPPDILRIDGKPVAEFVAASYPEAPRKRDYRPVGESLEWLMKRTGLTD
jgi:hypothetical protein